MPSVHLRSRCRSHTTRNRPARSKTITGRHANQRCHCVACVGRLDSISHNALRPSAKPSAMHQTGGFALSPYVPRGHTASFGCPTANHGAVLPRSDHGELYARACSFSAPLSTRRSRVGCGRALRSAELVPLQSAAPRRGSVVWRRIACPVHPRNKTYASF